MLSSHCIAGRDNVSFSLAADERTLDLEADTEAERDLWVSAFEWMVSHKDAMKEP